jgi:hypothetical protein
MSSKLYVFTFNNYEPNNTREAIEHWDLHSTYIGWGEEIAPSTGTPHLQGLVRFKNKIRPRQASNLLGEIFGVGQGQHIHCERAKGTFAQAKAYCEKEGRYTFRGEEPAQGKRSDLTIVAEKLSAGESLRDACSEHPGTFIRYSKGLIAWSQLHQPNRDFKTKVIWCHGPTGTGKTRWIHEQAPEAYWKDGRSKWWDGYQNEEAVVIDDFRPSADMPLPYVLRLFDRYPFQVECKGGMLKFNSKVIYVSAPWDPQVLYEKLPFEIGVEDIRQVCRRVDEVHHFPDIDHILGDVPDSPTSVVQTLNFGGQSEEHS